MPNFHATRSSPLAALLAVLVAALVAGCAAQIPTAPLTITPAMLVEGQPLTGGAEPPLLPDVDILGLAYLRRGDATSAQRWMARAEEVAGDETLKHSYHSKLELLRQQQAAGPPRGS